MNHDCRRVCCTLCHIAPHIFGSSTDEPALLPAFRYAPLLSWYARLPLRPTRYELVPIYTLYTVREHNSGVGEARTG